METAILEVAEGEVLRKYKGSLLGESGATAVMVAVGFRENQDFSRFAEVL